MAANPRSNSAEEEGFPKGTVGGLMEPPYGVFSPETTAGEVSEKLRDLSKDHVVTYCFVTDSEGRLLGVVTMRDLLLAGSERPLRDLMLTDFFSLEPQTPLLEAMRQTMSRHFPVYPVCDSGKHLLGLVRGQVLAEAQAFELTGQAGAMVGVEREERLSTPWLRSLRFRHPWLQLNLFTAFLAAGVVGYFEDTIERIVLLAVFLPVLAGQSGNTGCQALAVSLRAMTLGELREGREWGAMAKEAFLGLANGALVGLTAGVGMVVFAVIQKNPDAFALGAIVFVAMTASCLVSGVSGVAIPTVLRRFGADPATASSIFLTTATDIASMGCFLGLAAWWLM